MTQDLNVTVSTPVCKRIAQPDLTSAPKKGFFGTVCRALGNQLWPKLPNYSKLFEFLALKNEAGDDVGAHIQLFLNHFICQLCKFYPSSDGIKLPNVEISMRKNDVLDFFTPLGEHFAKILTEKYGIHTSFLSADNIPPASEFALNQERFFIVYNLKSDGYSTDAEYHAIPIFLHQREFFFPLENVDIQEFSVVASAKQKILENNDNYSLAYFSKDQNLKLYPTNFLCVTQCYAILKNIAEAIQSKSLFLKKINNCFIINPGIYSNLQSGSVFSHVKNVFNENSGKVISYQQERSHGLSLDSPQYALFYLHAMNLPISSTAEKILGLSSSIEKSPFSAFVVQLGKTYPQPMLAALQNLSDYCLDSHNNGHSTAS